jgi:Tol biopolymer transport system component
LDLASARDDPPNAIRVASLDGKLDRVVVPTASNAAYASGHLFYVSARENTLFARPFDLGRLETAGDPVPIAQQTGFGFRYHFQFSATERLLVFAPRLFTPSTLLWIDRSGKPGAVLLERGSFGLPRLSPDGRKVAVDVYDPARGIFDIWIYDAAKRVGTKFVVGSFPYSENPVWSPEGDRIVFFSYGKGKGAHTTLFVKRINGAGEEVLLASPDENYPEDWSSDGRFVSFMKMRTQGKIRFELWVLSIAGDRKATPFATEAPNQSASRFSPDGHWIAFESDESGKPEVYVRPFPGPGGKWQVSTAGGGSPSWRRDGKELFYLSADNKIMAVPVRLDPTFQAGSPAVLFSVRPGSNYDASGDGQRFLVNNESAEEGSPPLTLLTDWTALLKE